MKISLIGYIDGNWRRGMAFKFESLKVWQVSLDLSNQIDLVAKSFPEIELFSLTSQIKRAADSVNLNIAEGCMGQSKIEFKRFLTYSVRSGLEVVSCLFMAVTGITLQRQNLKSSIENMRNFAK